MAWLQEALQRSSQLLQVLIATLLCLQPPSRQRSSPGERPELHLLCCTSARLHGLQQAAGKAGGLAAAPPGCRGRDRWRRPLLADGRCRRRPTLTSKPHFESLQACKRWHPREQASSSLSWGCPCHAQSCQLCGYSYRCRVAAAHPSSHVPLPAGKAPAKAKPTAAEGKGKGKGKVRGCWLHVL